MSHHKHLTLEEREMILKYLSIGYSLSKIAEILSRNKSTISRELNRNSDKEGYFPKGQDLTNVPEEYIQKMYDKLNKRPRKCLGYKTPYEIYYSTVLQLT